MAVMFAFGVHDILVVAFFFFFFAEGFVENV
jgi:hypothetical protein